MAIYANSPFPNSYWKAGPSANGILAYFSS